MLVISNNFWTRNFFVSVIDAMSMQHDYQKLWFTGNLKEGKNEAVPEEPGKMEYTQPWMKYI